MAFGGLSWLTIILPALLAGSQDKWEDIRPIAEAQHEIVLLLIERQEFHKVPNAAREIFQLPFPESQEHRIVEEAEILTAALLHHSQTAIAHTILDEALRCVKAAQSKARIHREKAFVFKKEGKTDDAMREFEKSLELQKQGPQQ